MAFVAQGFEHCGAVLSGFVVGFSWVLYGCHKVLALEFEGLKA